MIRLTVLAAALFLALAAHAGPGDPDPAFGGSGKVTFTRGAADVTGTGVVILGDGKKLVSFASIGWEGHYGTIVRYNSDGTVDTTYGLGGTAPSPLIPYGIVASGAGILSVETGPFPGPFDNEAGAPYVATHVVKYDASGMVDPSFGTNGLTELINVSTNSGDQGWRAMAVQSDGKIVVAGYATPAAGGARHVWVARFTAAGVLDTSFGPGGTGWIRSPLPGVDPSAPTEVHAVSVQADGMILLAGYFGGTPPGPMGYTARLLADGTAFDSTYVGAGVAAIVSTSICNGIIAEAARYISSCNLESGQVVVGARLLNGNPDPGFTFVTAPGVGPHSLRALTSGSGGKYYATGWSGAGTNLMVLAINPNGGLDSGFGTGGAYLAPEGNSAGGGIAANASGVFVAGGGGATTSSTASFFSLSGTRTAYGETFTGSSYEAFRVRKGPGGSVYVAGSFGAVNQPTQSVSRYTASGSLDSTFGAGGFGITSIVVPGMAQYSTSVRDLQILGDGKLLITGDMGGLELGQFHANAARLLPTGGPDPGFDSGGHPGIALLPLGGPGGAFTRSVRVQADGKVLAHSTARPATQNFPAVVRFNTNGTVDNTYGSSGVATATFAGNTTGRGMVLDSTGRAVVMGSFGQSWRFARFTTGGALDGTYGTGGLFSVNVPAGTTLQAPTSYVIQPDGKTVAAGSALVSGIDSWIFIRVTATGAADTTFGTNGFVSIPTGAFAGSVVRDIAITPNGKIVGVGEVSGNAPYGGRGGIARLNANGTPDATWGTNGMRLYTEPNAILNFQGVEVLDDGALFVGGGIVRPNNLEGLVMKTQADPGAVPTGPAVKMDLSGEGRSDILLRGPSGEIVAWLMNGNSITTATLMLGGGSGYQAQRVGDLNGDGKMDLLVVGPTGQVVVWLMDGTSVASSSLVLAGGTGYVVDKLGDFNGDGKTDIVFRGAGGDLVMWLMDGTSVLSSAVVLAAGTGFAPAAVGDFDNNGRSDIVLAHTDGRVTMWLMNGTAIASSANLLGAGTGFVVSHVGDFDNDGDSDILFKGSAGQIVMWRMNGTTIASSSLLYGGGPWEVTHVADVNGNGMDDLVLKGPAGEIVIWQMNGSTILGATLMYGGGPWQITHVGDYNGDGLSDLLLKGPGGEIVVWIMNGATITSATLLVGATTYQAAP